MSAQNNVGVAGATVTGGVFEALATGLLDGGLQTVTNYPGYRSNELFDRLGGNQTSVSEKNAFAVAWGAAMAGWRAAVTFKNVGLNDAADPFLNSLVLDVNAGFVIVVFDDVDVEHSQLRLDSRHYFRFLGGLWFEPANVGDAYRVGREAFAVSEALGVPVVIRATNLLMNKLGQWDRLLPAPAAAPKPFRRGSGNFVVHPVNWAHLRERVAQRARAIQEWVNARHAGWTPPAGEKPVQLVCGAAPARQVEEPALHIDTLPLPLGVLAPLLASGRKICVHEYGDGVAAAMLREAGGTGGVTAVPLKHTHAQHKFRNFEHFEPLFRLLRAHPDRIVCGDLGGYTMDPSRTIDACLCYGVSVGVATGAALAASNSRVFCITGDGAYLHSGRSALDEAVARGVTLTVILFDNGGCLGTGGQRIPGSLQVPDAGVLAIDVTFPEAEAEKLAAALDRCLAWQGVSVLRVKTPL